MGHVIWWPSLVQSTTVLTLPSHPLCNSLMRAHPHKCLGCTSSWIRTTSPRRSWMVLPPGRWTSWKFLSSNKYSFVHCFQKSSESFCLNRSSWCTSSNHFPRRFPGVSAPNLCRAKREIIRPFFFFWLASLHRSTNTILSKIMNPQQCSSYSFGIFRLATLKFSETFWRSTNLFIFGLDVDNVM